MDQLEPSAKNRGGDVLQSLVETRLSEKPDGGMQLPSVISLFCGAGGLDWGFEREGFRIPLAIDLSPAAIRTHARNFKNCQSVAGDLVKLGPTGVLDLANRSIPQGSRIGVIGGPPCQGFSRANTSPKENDPRNSLPALYLEIVKSLQQGYTVEFVVFENVLGIRDKKHAKTYENLLGGLADLGFDVTEKELCAVDFGVAQNRRRIVLSALRSGQGYLAVRPVVSARRPTVRDMIERLEPPVFYQRGLVPERIPGHPNHWTMKPKSARFRSPLAVISDGRSFKQLKWDAPSPTIAFGNREIHVHPTGTRRLSIYEAMLLQGFPHSFVLEGNLSEQVEQVSNAVPPPLARSVAAAVKLAIQSSG